MVAPAVKAGPACPRCGSRLSYQTRPCHVCYSPTGYTLRDGEVVDAPGVTRAATVRLPEYALPPHLRGKRIRPPRHERVVAVAKTIGRWTWNSVGIAAGVHLVALVVAMFMVNHVPEVVKHVQQAAISRELTAAVDPADEPDALQMPDISPLDDELVISNDIMHEIELEIGDPEIVAPPEEIYAPEPQVAPPAPSQPDSHAFRRPDAGQGLGGGQPVPSSEQPAGSGLFRNRQGESKQSALKEFGGGEDTENAVNLGLEYLARNQDANGSWDPSRGFVGGGGHPTFRQMVTALCTLPFLAAGHTPKEGSYQDNVARAIDWLMAQQSSDGNLGNTRSSNQMYGHTVGTLVLCEAFGMCGDEAIGKAAERAVRFLERTQGRNGGWCYTASLSSQRAAERNDLSITGWGVLALNSARAVGIKVNDRTWDAMAGLYHNHSLDNGETYYADRDYGSLSAKRKGIGMVGVGLASRVILDRARFEKRNYAAERLLLENKPDYQRFFDPSAGASNPNFNTYYGWYYSTLGMFLLNEGRGTAWESWNTALKEALLKNQVLTGSRRGSWRPDDSWIGPFMGDFYSTALAVLCLEIYYRYTSTHKLEGPRLSGKPNPPKPIESGAKPANAVQVGSETFDLGKPADRSKYLRYLSRDQGLAAVPVLLKHLGDESLSVRSSSLSELSRLKSKDAVKPVREMLLDPDNDPIRLAIIDALGGLGDRSVHPTLIRLLSDPDEPVRRTAQAALTRLAGGKDLGANRRSWEDWFERNP